MKKKTARPGMRSTSLRPVNARYSRTVDCKALCGCKEKNTTAEMAENLIRFVRIINM
jgi:hypothetical protein